MYSVLCTNMVRGIFYVYARPPLTQSCRVANRNTPQPQCLCECHSLYELAYSFVHAHAECFCFSSSSSSFYMCSFVVTFCCPRQNAEEKQRRRRLRRQLYMYKNVPKKFKLKKMTRPCAHNIAKLLCAQCTVRVCERASERMCVCMGTREADLIFVNGQQYKITDYVRFCCCWCIVLLTDWLFTIRIRHKYTECHARTSYDDNLYGTTFLSDRFLLRSSSSSKFFGCLESRGKVAFIQSTIRSVVNV